MFNSIRGDNGNRRKGNLWMPTVVMSLCNAKKNYSKSLKCIECAWLNIDESCELFSCNLLRPCESFLKKKE